MAKKEDIKQVEDISKKYGLTAEERRDFGDYLEDLKRSSFAGTKNEKGDFTFDELDRHCQDFVNQQRG